MCIAEHIEMISCDRTTTILYFIDLSIDHDLCTKRKILRCSNCPSGCRTCTTCCDRILHIAPLTTTDWTWTVCSQQVFTQILILSVRIGWYIRRCGSGCRSSCCIGLCGCHNDGIRIVLANLTRSAMHSGQCLQSRLIPFILSSGCQNLINLLFCTL